MSQNFYILLTGSTGLIYYTTGSASMQIPIIFIDGRQAAQDYGISVRVYNGPCPICNTPLSQPLALNPFSGHFFLQCCGCLRWFRWLNYDGTPSDHEEVPRDYASYTGGNWEDDFGSSWVSEQIE